jgi:hypothetical protein
MERRMVARRLVFGALMAIGTFAATVPWRATGEVMERVATCSVPPGHPAVEGCAERAVPDAPSQMRLPPGHPPLGAGALPPGHPPVGARPSLPPGHPPVGGLSRDGMIIQPPVMRSFGSTAPVVNL